MPSEHDKEHAASHTTARQDAARCMTGKSLQQWPEHPHSPLPVQRILEAGLRKACDALLCVVHAHGHSRAIKLVDLPLLLTRTDTGLSSTCQDHHGEGLSFAALTSKQASKQASMAQITRAQAHPRWRFWQLHSKMVCTTQGGRVQSDAAGTGVHELNLEHLLVAAVLWLKGHGQLALAWNDHVRCSVLVTKRVSARTRQTVLHPSDGVNGSVERGECADVCSFGPAAAKDARAALNHAPTQQAWPASSSSQRRLSSLSQSMARETPMHMMQASGANAPHQILPIPSGSAMHGSRHHRVCENE